MKILSLNMRLWWFVHNLFGHGAIGVFPSSSWAWWLHDRSALRMLASEKRALARRGEKLKSDPLEDLDA